MITALCLLVLLLCLVYVKRSILKPANFPPGPFWYPLTGCTNELKKLSIKLGGHHKAMGLLAKNYNTNVLGLNLGSSLTVTVFSHEVVKEVLKSEDFDARPDNLFIRLRTMGKKIGITCADGEHWQVQRSFVLKHMRQLGFGKALMEDMIQEELRELLQILNDTDKSAVHFGPYIASSVISILWSLVAGTRISRDDNRLKEMLKLLRKRQTAFDMAGGILNMFPWLRFIAPEKSGYNLILKLNKEMENFFLDAIKSHYAEWTPGRDDDVIHAFISEMRSEKNVHPSFTADQLIMICQDILIAGSQTTSHSLEFAILMMILHPDVQKKVQQEIDSKFNREEVISYSDRASLPYVEAVIMEVARYCTIAPIIGPRRALRQVELDNYVIPKDTTVLISNYSVHMDKNFWGDPEEFIPERFLDENGQLKPSERLIAFGLGRRRCPGESLARSCIFLFFVGILQKYTITHSPDYPKPTGKPLPGITLVPEEYRVKLTDRRSMI